MKITKKQQEKLAQQMADPPEVRFAHFFRKMILIATIVAVIIALVFFGIFASNTDNQTKIKQMIMILALMFVASLLWYWLKTSINKIKGHNKIQPPSDTKHITDDQISNNKTIDSSIDEHEVNQSNDDDFFN